MPYSMRPTRQAAQAASHRISKWAQNDNTSTDSITITPPENGLTRARRLGYDETIFITRYLVDQCAKAEFEEQRIEIAEKLFDILISSPSVLIYESKLRNTVLTKVKEFDEYIDKRNESFKKAQYREAIDMMKLSMLVNIRNSKIRDSINKHLAEINIILNKYAYWSRNHSLKLQLKKMNNILESIKRDPDYVIA